jgi:tRNA-specific 2-thiouridylase
MKIFCAVSGGVDSGVAAAILKERGDDVRGLYMRHRYQPTLDADETRRVLEKWESGEESARPALYSVARNGELTEIAPDAAVAFWSERGLPVDAVSAFETTAFLGIPLTILDVDAPFAAVVENFVDEYYAAQTPNPCALCNRTIKFGLLDDVCRRLGGERLATGHYVRKRRVADWVAELETAAKKAAKSKGR